MSYHTIIISTLIASQWLFVSSSSAALTPIFRSPKSPFASGQIHQTKLSDGTQKIISQSWSKIHWQNISGWLPSSQLISPNHFHKYVYLLPQTPLRNHPHWNLSPNYKLQKTQIAEVIIIEEDWALIFFPKNKKKGWVPLKHLRAHSKDLGFAYVKKNTSLFRDLQNKQPILNLPPNTRLSVIKIKKSQLLVKYKNNLGYIPIHHCLNKVLLAKSIQTSSSSQWLPVHKITLKGLQTPYGITPFEAIKKIKTKENLFFISKQKTFLHPQPNFHQESTKHIPILQPVMLLKEKSIKWGLSQVKTQHPTDSKVWWKIPSLTSTSPPKQIKIKNNSYSTQEIFKRKIYSIAISPTIPNLMFASAKGVFRSFDGQKWQKLSQFGHHNHPIAISNNGHVFIGSYKSNDLGQTFHSFLRWDKIAWAIHYKKKSEPNHLRLQKIKIIDHSARKISITVKTQKKAHTLISNNNGKTWSVLK